MTARCAYLVSRYPSITHTFVLGEVATLRASGVDVRTATVHRAPDAQILTAEDAAERERTYAIQPARPLAVAAAHLAALARSPRAYASTLAYALRTAHAGGRARLWQAFYFAEAMLLWRWMARADLRHVHVHHANVSSDLAMLACRFGRAATGERWTWSMTIHGPTELLDLATHKLALKVADASAVVCTSDFAHSQILALGAHDGVHTVRCGIDVEAFAPASRAGRDGAVTVLYVAALSARKGHAVLLDAIARVDAPVRLVLAGDGPERAALEARVAALGIGDRVELLGAVPHDRIPALMAEADLFCMPSFAEGLPTVLIEAMACELPVVATNVMGTAELVEDGVSGFVVAPSRADLLAERIARLAADPELRARMGAAGRAKVVRDHEAKAAAGALRGVLGPLLG